MQAPFADPLLRLKQVRTELPLVGREAEMHALHTLLHTVMLDAQVGARALTISGEIGVGKTRLLAALCQEAGARSFRVLNASAYEAGAMFPYLPFVEALRPLIRSSTSEQIHRYAGLPASSAREAGSDADRDAPGAMVLVGVPLIAALARLFPELLTTLHIATVPAEFLSPDQEKFRVFDAVATLLERAALDQPILLCIDNLQWADSASLQLLLYLTVRLRTARVALAGATRPPRLRSEAGEDDGTAQTASANSAAARALADLMREGLLYFLPLGPLNTDAAARHLQALLPGTIPQGVVQALLMRAEGNPFFLEELVRMQTLKGQLVLHDGVWRATRASSSALPESIIAAVRQRLQGLSEQCHELLQIASLFGSTFPLQALAQVAGYSTDEMQTFIDEAAQAALIATSLDQSENDQEEGCVTEGAEAVFPERSLEAPPQLYLFCQRIVQEALQASLPAYQVRLLHSAIGRALEASYGRDAAKHAAELARHYAQGGEREATLRWSLCAGEDAVRQQAHREAINHFRLALKLREAEDDDRAFMPGARPTIAELHIAIGELWFKLGELEQAINVFQQALQQLQVRPDAPALAVARAHRLLADAYRMQTRYDLALAHLQAAGTAFDIDTSANELASAAKAQMVRAPWFPGRSIPSSSAALHLNVERILFLQSQATLDILLNRPEEAEAALWQSHQLATELGDRGSQAFALHLVGYLRGWGEGIHEAIRLQEQAHELYLAIGDPFHAALGDQGLGIIYQALGEMERARFYTHQGMELARRYGIRHIPGWLHWNLGNMALVQGDWESSLSHLQQALQEAITNNDARLKPLVMQSQAELQFRRGNWREAEQFFLDSIQAATATEWFPGSVALYGHFLAVTGRRTAARAQLDRAAASPEPPGFGGDFYIPFLAEGYLHLDALECAAPYIERIRHLRGFLYYGYSVDRILGVIALQMGDGETARDAFEDGLLLCRRANNQPEEATILYEQARAALMSGDPLPHVHESGVQARTLFIRCGMQRASAMVDELLEGAGQLEQHSAKTLRVSVSQQQRNGYTLEQRLTKRELEVLRLVAEGHTDREVADTLVISPRTANRHLSNIFVKLAVPGRAAAVAYAIRQGLV